MPLRFLIKTAFTVVTPPVIFNSFPLPVTHLTAVEPPRDRRRVASLLFRDCTAVVLRRHGGDGGATAGGTAVTEVLHVKRFRRATAKVRGFDSLPRC